MPIWTIWAPWKDSGSMQKCGQMRKGRRLISKFQVLKMILNGQFKAVEGMCGFGPGGKYPVANREKEENCGEFE